MKTSAREYLIGLGLAKATRGKFSNVAKAALNDAIASGQEFSDYTIEGKPKEPTYDTPEKTWPDSSTAIYVDNGSKCGLSNACNSCGHSLQWCDCPHPTVNMRSVSISVR